MRLSFSILLVFLTATTVLTLSRPGLAEEGDFDQLERVQELQRSALAAARAAEWQRARELAEVVLTLDDSVFTADCRLILVKALEQERQLNAALYELGQFLVLPLSPTQARRGQRLKRRLERTRDLGESRSVPGLNGSARPQLASGVGTLLGGVVLSVTGGYFIGVDIYWNSLDVPSGTWAAIGTPLLVGGLVLDVAGVLLLRRAKGPRASSADLQRFERRPRVSVAWTSDQLAFQIGGVW